MHAHPEVGPARRGPGLALSFMATALSALPSSNTSAPSAGPATADSAPTYARRTRPVPVRRAGAPLSRGRVLPPEWDEALELFLMSITRRDHPRERSTTRPIRVDHSRRRGRRCPCDQPRQVALISAFGVLASPVLLAGAVREYRSGESALWIAAGAVIFLRASYALVRDVRRLRTGQAA